MQDRVLSAIHPRHNAAPPEKWQQRKSLQTRDRLVEAGIACLVESGYSGLTTAAVAQRCDVSRGAMHHHFANRMELVAAVVEIVFYRRMRNFLRDYFEALDKAGEERLVEIASEAHWRSVHTREYAAYLELAMASRIDAELATQFVPAARRYDEVWTSEMIEAFPQWKRHWDAMQLASDFTLAAQMGMLVHEMTLGNGGQRVARMQALVTRTIRDLYDGEG